MKNIFKKIAQDFVVDDRREYKFKLGSLIASGLSGFLVGIISTIIFWYFVLR